MLSHQREEKKRRKKNEIQKSHFFLTDSKKNQKKNLFRDFGVLLKLLSIFCRESEGKLPTQPFWGWIWVGKWNLNCIKCSLKLVQIKSTSVPRSSGLMWLFICTRFNSYLIKFEFLYFSTLIHPQKVELIDISYLTLLNINVSRSGTNVAPVGQPLL